MMILGIVQGCATVPANIAAPIPPENVVGHSSLAAGRKTYVSLLKCAMCHRPNRFQTILRKLGLRIYFPRCRRKLAYRHRNTLTFWLTSPRPPTQLYQKRVQQMNRRKMITQMGLGALAAANLTALQAYAETLPGSDPLPGLFIGHGNPMNAIEENHFVRGFRQIASAIPKPKAILCVSAHWFIDGTKVTAMDKPKTIHDFGGFPKELHEAQYPAPGVLSWLRSRPS